MSQLKIYDAGTDSWIPAIVGAEGATGPAGTSGDNGATGATGPAGPAGVTWKGNWDSGTTYNQNDIVQYAGSEYIALTTTISNQPDLFQDWAYFVPGVVGATGATGPAGTSGTNGATGATGPAGTSGTNGATGATGAFDGNLTQNLNGQGYSISNVSTITTTGNITGNYILGNGSQLTGLPATYGNSNVVTLMSDYGSNTISTTGNITSGNLNATSGVANVANLFMNTGYVNTAASAGINFVPGSTATGTRVWSKLVPNANVAFSLGSTTEYWANGYIGNTISTTVSATANVTGGNILTSGQVSATANVTGGNVLTGGLVSATGNATGGNILTSGQVSATGNITGGNAIILGSTTGVYGLDVGVTSTFLSNTVASFTSNVNNYTQVTNQNINTGTDATADYILTADNGSDTVNYSDFGIINSGYDNGTPTNSLGNIVYAADTYLYAQGNVNNTAQSGGNLVIGTTTANKTVKVFAGGNTNSALVANISNTGIAVTGVISATGNINGNNIAATSLILNGTTVGYGVTTPTIGSNTSPVTGTITASTVGAATTIMTVAIPSAGTWQIVAQVNCSLTAGQECIFVLYDGTGTFVAGTETRSGYIGGASFQGQGSSLWTVTTVGAVNYTVRAFAPGATANCSITNAGDGRTNVSWTLMNQPVTLNSMTVPTAISVVGNVYANNWQGQNSNVTLVAGSYSTTFNNAGNLLAPGAISATGTVYGFELSSTESVGDEGGQINLAIPQTNTSLANSVTIDIYQNKIRIFEGSASAKGVAIDLNKAPNGVGGELLWKASGMVNAGVDVTLGNLKARIPTSGNRSLQVSTVSGTYSVYGSDTYSTGGAAGGTSILNNAAVTVTTTPTYLNAGLNFPGGGNTDTWLIMDTGNTIAWRIIVIIGSGYANNMISIERLL